MTYDGDTVRFTSWRSRRLSRRNVLRTSGLGAAGLTAAALIGCGSDDEDTGGSGGTSGASGGGSAGSNVQTSGQSAAFERKGTLFLRDTPQTQDFHRHTARCPRRRWSATRRRPSTHRARRSSSSSTRWRPPTRRTTRSRSSRA